MSFSISSRSEELTDHLFVEASAGTGKTYVIEHYLVRSILTSQVHPEKVALITFTKAVARELRLRLKATLQASLLCIVNEDRATAPDYVLAILEQDALYRSKAARAVEDALERLGEAVISTIHGFCDRLLTLWGEEVGDDYSEKWVGDEEKKTWLAEFLQEAAGFRGGEFDVVAKRYRHSQDTLIEHLVKLMDGIDLCLGRTEDCAWEDAQQAVEKIRKKGNGAAIAGFLSAAAKGYRGNMRKDGALKPDVSAAFSVIQEIVEYGVDEGKIEKLYGFSLPKCFETPLVKKTVLASDEEEARYILEELWPYLEDLVNEEHIVRRLALRAARAFMDFVVATDKKTPEAVIHRVLELSQAEGFLKWAANSVEWLIVDEFQDTDGVQYAILSRLFLDNPLWHGHVLFVGDPKQAIYGFRKADVYSYLAAKQSLQPHQIRTLAVNYRADRRVVEAQNRLFAGKEHPWIFYLPRAQTSLNVVPCSSGKEEMEPIGDSRGALHLIVARGHQGRRRRWPHDEVEQKLFSWICDEMICLHDKGIPFRRQAILVKDRYQAKRAQHFLEDRGVPTCAWRVDSITESSMYPWLQKACSLAMRPQDQRRLSTLLLSMPSEYNLELCRAMSEDKRLDQWASCARAWNGVKEAFYKGGIAGMAREIRACRWNGRDTVEGWLQSIPNGRELLIDLEHLCELLSLLDTKLPRSLESYADALNNITGYFSEDIELLTRRVDPDDEGAPILTMHRSKGLEFDIVYAIGCASRTIEQEEIALDEADAEKLRQLYVSITRAKRRCYLPVLIEEDEKPISLGHASPVELLFAAFASDGSPSTAWLSTLYHSISSDARLSLAERLCAEVPNAITMSDCAVEYRHLTIPKGEQSELPSRVVSLPPWISRSYHSFTSESRKGSLSAGGVQEQKRVDPSGIPELSSSAVFGIQFHKAIAKLLFAPQEARSSVDSVKRWLKNAGEYEEAMAQLLYDAVRVQLPLDGEVVCLDQIPRENMRAECAFLDKEDGERYLRGVLDLVFLWKGVVYAIDWKTHVVEEGGCTAVVEHDYERQHRLYLQAVLRAFAPEYQYGGFFFIFVRYLGTDGIVFACGGPHG
jgi:exodeoxyribonuclease V beta subunit